MSAQLAAVPLTVVVTTMNKREQAIAYLRERGKYCLDQRAQRIPVKERPQTVLDRWLKERHK